MKLFLIEYVSRDGATHYMPVNAEDKSKAYISSYLDLSMDNIITSIYEVV